MNNQQKIEFYLSKGFAVKVEYANGEKSKFIAQDSEGEFCLIASDGLGKFSNEHSLEQAKIKIAKVTPIPPKPYKFRKGDKAIVVATGEIITIDDMDDYKYWSDFPQVYSPYELAPALPEEEDKGIIYVEEKDILTFLETVKITCGGKEVKIKKMP